MLHLKHKKLIETATVYALRSPMRYKYACVFAKGNKILSIGYNKYVLTPLSGLRTTHAEIDALLQIPDKTQLNGAYAIVIRVNIDSNYKKCSYLSATPCYDCEVKLKKIMRKYGLKAVYYTTDMNL